jgi:acyl dehydratase
MQKMEWNIGAKYALGSKAFDQEEIFEFARSHDPLEFHLSLEAAQKSRFKGLVCSGGQAFYYFYPKAWVPKFGSSVIAGMGLKEWNFLAPIYVNDQVTANCEIKNIQPARKTDEVIIDWFFEFKNESGQLVQNLHLTVLHQK